MVGVAPLLVPFIWARVNTDERLKSATMRKYEAQAAAVWGQELNVRMQTVVVVVFFARDELLFSSASLSSLE